jgi:hypothetical protein
MLADRPGVRPGPRGAGTCALLCAALLAPALAACGGGDEEPAKTRGQVLARVEAICKRSGREAREFAHANPSAGTLRDALDALGADLLISARAANELRPLAGEDAAPSQLANFVKASENVDDLTRELRAALVAGISKLRDLEANLDGARVRARAAARAASLRRCPWVGVRELQRAELGD